MAAGKEIENEIQKQLLLKLDAYGDSVLEKKLKIKKKKKRKITDEVNEKDGKTENETGNNSHNTQANVNTSNRSGLSKRKKRKMRKKAEKEQLEQSEAGKPPETEEENKKAIVGRKKQVNLLVGELGLKQFKTDKEKQVTICDSEGKLSVGAGNQTAAKKEPEVVVFTSQRNRKPKQKIQILENDNKGGNPAAFDIKEARFEVRKFGVAGFQGVEKEKAMADLLLKLGAKPKKKAHINYKVLQEQRKQELMLEAQKMEQDKRNGLKVGMKKTKKRDRDRMNVDGQVGKFVHGVQFVKPNDLHGLKKSKLKVKS